MNTTTPHILVVDDHAEIRDLVGKYLTKQELRVSMAASAPEARKLLGNSAIDLVVLDIMMPGEDGLSLCRHLRETTQIPVILLTALGEDTDRIVGLEMGADDYLTKPFNPRELLARIKAVLRRAQSLPVQRDSILEGAICFDRWRVDTKRREIIAEDGVATALSTAEFKLLVAFLNHPGHVLSRDQLTDLTKGQSGEVFDRSIDNQVSRLRRKIESDPKNPDLIKTVWGGGYRFTGDVTRGHDG